MIKQVPGRCTPGYYQINLNQHDSPFGGDELIKEADAFDRPDSHGESLWIAFWDPFPVPIVSESRFGLDRGSTFVDELSSTRISLRLSFPAVVN